MATTPARGPAPMPSSPSPSPAAAPDGALQLEIAHMEGLVWSGPVRVVGLPGAEGAFGVLHGHTPLLTRLRAGFVHIETPAGERIEVYVSGGYVEIQPARVTVLADTAVRNADLDAARAEAAKQAASSLLGGELAHIDHALLHAEIARAAAQWAHEARKLSGR
ncbi:ATP synthase F1 subunit epsilon [Paracidovorax citrulli]|uniref:ATP synthase epsilon chain n=2 Tax=Paracidovorax citrulli TaxID=80869 RepID=A1TN47_PARC0|nr:ATP synthase F1 subcomplex epsilon subunit [Paracidovorax citrulli AAC00-1]ATG94596.1 ATP synthase F1 subunit epsilon [Paracidovorax citrulli]